MYMSREAPLRQRDARFALEARARTNKNITNRFIEGMLNYNLTSEEIDSGAWKYCGGDQGTHREYFYKKFPNTKLPNHTETCVCGVNNLVKNFYITDSTEILIIGSECINSHIPGKKFRNCNICGTEYRKRKDNIDKCKDCRDKYCDKCDEPYQNDEKKCYCQYPYTCIGCNCKHANTSKKYCDKCVSKFCNLCDRPKAYKSDLCPCQYPYVCINCKNRHNKTCKEYCNDCEPKFCKLCKQHKNPHKQCPCTFIECVACKNKFALSELDNARACAKCRVQYDFASRDPVCAADLITHKINHPGNILHKWKPCKKCSRFIQPRFVLCFACEPS